MKNEPETSRERILAELVDLEDDLAGCTDTGIATLIVARMEELRRVLRDTKKT